MHFTYGLIDYIHCQYQGGPGIAIYDCGLVLSKVALKVELTTYVITNISFFRQIRLDVIR